MITTIIPTFKRPLLLRRSIESVLTQSYGDFTVMVCDNASNDETEDVVREYMRHDKRIIYVKRHENIGAVNNMTAGVNAVNTSYYSLLNDDDFLLPGFYERAIASFKENQDSFFSCQKTLVSDIQNKNFIFLNPDWDSGVFSPSPEVVSKMFNSHFVPTAVLFRKEIKDQTGGFDPLGSDSIYLTILAAAFPFVVVNHYGGSVTLHSEAYSMVNDGLNKESFEFLNHALKAHIRLIANLNLPSDVNTSLLFHVILSYQRIFDSKNLKALFGDAPSESLRQSVPSLITNRGLARKFYLMTPSSLKPIYKNIYSHISKYRAKKAQNNDSRLVHMSEEALQCLNTNSSDLSRVHRQIFSLNRSSP